ncbi:hypothetical protein DFH27DRAFT_144071 [Peziza echinospora]|nr:hypothetical protein DFH27DRAFT_144071 [Peziza echinospora]
METTFLPSRAANSASANIYRGTYCTTSSSNSSNSSNEPRLRRTILHDDNDGHEPCGVPRVSNMGNVVTGSAKNHLGATVSRVEAYGIMAKEAGPAGGKAKYYGSAATGTHPLLPQTEGTPRLKKTQRMKFGQPREHEQPIHISIDAGTGSMPAAHGSHDPNVTSSACEYDEMDFSSYWYGEPSRTPTTIAATLQSPHGMEERDVEPLELQYQRALGVKTEPEYGSVNGGLSYDGSETDKPLMMKATRNVHDIKNDARKETNDGQRKANDKEAQRPMPQTIPHILIQTVTPPDSKPLQQQRQPKDEITTGRPSPALAPIASRQCLPPVNLVPTNNRLPREVNLATPEYTLNTPHASITRQVLPNDTTIRAGPHKEAACSASQYESFKNRVEYEALTNPGSELTRNPHSVQSSVTQASPVAARRGANLYAGTISNSTSWSQVMHTDSEKTIGQPGLDRQGYESDDTGTPTIVIVGHDCPSENYIHQDFTKESLRRKWEYVQSYTQWPKLKGPDLWSRRTPYTGVDWCESIIAQGHH